MPEKSVIGLIFLPPPGLGTDQLQNNYDVGVYVTRTINLLHVVKIETVGYHCLAQFTQKPP